MCINTAAQIRDFNQSVFQNRIIQNGLFRKRLFQNDIGKGTESA